MQGESLNKISWPAVQKLFKTALEPNMQALLTPTPPHCNALLTPTPTASTTPSTSTR